MSSNPYISVVVPCFNEEHGLGELLRRITASCGPVGKTYEVVLVDDGSSDGTWQTMTQIAAQDPRVIAVKLSRNHGHQLALTAGLSICRGERILIMDADLQDPPELLPKMLEVMDQGVDIVYGQRAARTGEPLIKLVCAFVFYRTLQYLTRTPIPVDTGDFRLISRRALNVLLSMPERHRYIRGMISWIGFKQKPILYERDLRFEGTTKYPFRKSLLFAIDAVTGFSNKPLALASSIGALGALFSLGALAFALISWSQGKAVAGWASIMACIGIIGSLQMVCLGIFGEYLGRLYEQSKNRPLFIVEDVVGRDRADGKKDGA